MSTFQTKSSTALSESTRQMFTAPDVALTVLQSGDGFALLAVLTVPDVIGGFHSELVGCEGLQPGDWKHMNTHQS